MSTMTFPLHEERDRKNARLVAWIVTGVLALILLLVLIFINIITPIPAIPPDPEVVAVEVGLFDGSGGTAANQGGGSQGNTGTPGTQLPDGGAPDPTPVQATPANGAITSDDPSNPQANSGEPHPSSALMNTIANWNKNKGSASIKVGGDGTGSPYTSGAGGGTGDGPGPGDGGDPGHGGGGGNSKCSRSIISKPEIVNPTQEEGKVVVNVYVDRDGKVKKTEVNAAGTTTVNSVLRATATQSAYKIKFNADQTCAELIVLPIDINFTLK